jgi:hypothetical protein
MGRGAETGGGEAPRAPLGRADIVRYLGLVGEQLAGEGITGEILIVGGAYVTLVLEKREATKDVDAYFAAHADAIRRAADRVAGDHGLPRDWLNDAVKGFIHTQPTKRVWLELPGPRVHAPDPAYIFAMKAYAGRPEDVRDLRTLRDVIGLASAADALELVTRYIPERFLTPRVGYLVDLFDADD